MLLHSIFKPLKKYPVKCLLNKFLQKHIGNFSLTIIYYICKLHDCLQYLINMSLTKFKMSLG